MYTRSGLAVLTIVTAIVAAPTVAADSTGLGKDISEKELAEWNINIQPTGAGLPAGSGTAAAGQQVYTTKCVGCHGLKGEGGLAPPLISNHPIQGIDEGTVVLAGYWPYASTLFDYIRRAMPWQSPRSLTDDEVYALCAFILAGNGLIPQTETIDASNLAQVPMPNRNGFIVRFPKLTPAFKAP
jgi:S-disulfanyl-L-cysteine oxidoreductase SoxD